MRYVIFSLLTSLLSITNIAFSETLITCENQEGSQMSFSETSFSGKPLLNFTSTTTQINLSGDQIKIKKGFHPRSGMWVQGTHGDNEFRQTISFAVPPLNGPKNPQEPFEPFDTTVTVTTTDACCITGNTYEMNCIAHHFIAF